MGFSTTVYVGVYMEVPKGEKVVEKKVFIDSDTGMVTGHPFSPTSGKPNKEQIRPLVEPIYPDPMDVRDGEWEDDFLSFEFCGAGGDKHTWLPNNNKYGKHFDVEELRNSEMSEMDPYVEVSRFQEENREFIRETVKLYGSVEVKFGMAMVAS